MNPEASLPPILKETEAPAITAGGRVLTTAWRTIVFFWKYLVGALFCQSLLGAIAIVGWTYRLSQRSALRYWWSCRGENRKSGERFRDHLAQHETAHEHLHWPNWFAAQNFRKAIQRNPGTSTASHAWQLVQASFQSLVANIKLGLQGIFNTWVFTMPACILWLFSWYDGWNNSFNKGYEQAFVGPAVGWLGIMLFIAAMFYVPLAQARQAVTGEWRSFYHFGLVWGLVRRHWLACLALAGLTSLFFLPLMIMKTAPQFFGSKDPNLTAGEVVKVLNGYFFVCAFLVFPLFVALRVLAARVYARGILQGVQTGEIAVTDLAPKERLELHRLNLIQVNPPRSRHVLLRVARSTTSLVLLGIGAWATALIWFTFVAQIYISEFLSYHGAMGWLNQPLVQLPWFRYIPAHAQNAGGEIFLTALIVTFGLAVSVVAQRARRLLRH